MLRNDPPPQTLVRFVREVRQAKQSDTAFLVGPIEKYRIDRPADLFKVQYRGEIMTVRRDDIEEV